jgi:hypothetical protein
MKPVRSETVEQSEVVPLWVSSPLPSAEAFGVSV